MEITIYLSVQKDKKMEEGIRGHYTEDHYKQKRLASFCLILMGTIELKDEYTSQSQTRRAIGKIIVTTKVVARR